jgi:hypothetical protein
VIHRLLLVLGAVALLLVSCSPATAGTFPVNICGSSARDRGDGVSSSANSPLVASAVCPAAGLGLSFYANREETVGQNVTAAFKVTAPPGISVYSIRVVGAYSHGVGTNGWWGEFYWNGGPGPAGRSGSLDDAQFNAGGCCSQTNLQSSTIGWFIACNKSDCSTGNAGVDRGMTELDLTAEEDRAPTIAPSGAGNLWDQTGWVRGTWNASFTASDPSGVCNAAVAFGTLPAIATRTPDTSPNRHAWQQCPDQSVSAVVDTGASDGSIGRGEGAMSLRLTATNTAGMTAGPTTTVSVDNSTPTISLSGPTNAPSTAGTQYVTATAAGSPSGIDGFSCSIDGGPAEWFSGASTRVPVREVGEHTVSCSALNNAVDSSGHHGESAPASRSLKIGAPTVMGIAFTRIVDRLRCRRVRERVRIPARWVTVRVHGKPVRVRTRATVEVVRVTRCSPRLVRKRVTVWQTVIRNGKKIRVKRTKVVRVAVPPHVADYTARAVGWAPSAVLRSAGGRSGCSPLRTTAISASGACAK